MSPPAKFRVAICGGGSGGLTLALALTAYPDIEIDIYEAAAQFEELGAGFGIWGRGLAALKKLGLEDKIRPISAEPDNFENTNMHLRRSDRPEGGAAIGNLVLSPSLGLQRSRFVDRLAALLADTKRATVHFAKRAASFTQSEDSTSPVTITFADGTSATCDVLVGCDGIKSTIRGELLQQVTGRIHDGSGKNKDLGRFAGTQFSGTVAYRALVKPDDLRKVDANHSALSKQTVYCGKDRHFVAYPVSDKFLNIIGYASDPAKHAEWEEQPWTVLVEHDELAQEYRDFEPEVQAIIKCIGKSSRWALYDVEPQEFWSKGRVTLLGDAAHAMVPFLGSGGGRGIEDVYILARLLGAPLATRATLPAVLRAYEQVSRPHANKVVEQSRVAKDAFEYVGAFDTDARVVQGLGDMTAWLWEDRSDLDDDVREAERLVQEHIKAT